MNDNHNNNNDSFPDPGDFFQDFLKEDLGGGDASMDLSSGVQDANFLQDSTLEDLSASDDLLFAGTSKQATAVADDDQEPRMHASLTLEDRNGMSSFAGATRPSPGLHKSTMLSPVVGATVSMNNNNNNNGFGEILPLVPPAASTTGRPQGYQHNHPTGSTSHSATAAAAVLNAQPLNIGLGNFGRPKAQQSKQKNTSAVLANMNASTSLSSNMNDGLLSLAIKAKYNNSMQPPGGGGRQSKSNMSLASNHSAGFVSSLASVQEMRSHQQHHQDSFASAGSSSGNAQWGTPNTAGGGGPSRTASSSSSLFQNILMKPTSKTNLNLGSTKNPNKLTATKSTSAISKMLLSTKQPRNSRNNLHKHSATSIQDLLRGSRKMTKTQSLLRESSAQSLMKRTSSQNLKAIPLGGKVDVSHLARPAHIQNQQNASFASVPHVTAAAAAVASEHSLLHESCRLYPTTLMVVESAVRIDPQAVRRAIATSAEGGSGKEVYGYPLNIAIKYGGSLEVLTLLAQQGPDVVVLKDGTEASTSLHIALQQRCPVQVIQMLLQTNAECSKMVDRRANTPLHIAIQSANSLEIVRLVFAAYPKALEMRNFHSMTPLDVAQKSTRCPEAVMNFLQSIAFSPLERRALEAPTARSNSKEDNNTHAAGIQPRSGGASRDLEDNLDDIMQTNL